jgi:hypothetical protein
MADTFQVDMERLPITEIELLSRWELIQSTQKQVQILERKLDQYISKGGKNSSTFNFYVRKRKLEIVRLRSILKFIEV